MDDNSLFFALNRRLNIFTRCLSVRLIHGLAVLVLAGGNASAWAQEEPADPVAGFCDLVMVGGSGGSSCAALAEAAESTARVSYEPAESPWRLGEGPTEGSGPALFSAALGSGERSCLRLRLRLGEGRQLVETNLRYTVDAGDSTGALTILLERDGEAAEEILRASGEAAWATLSHTVDLDQSSIVGISICYEKGSGTDAGLDWAGVDNIRLEIASPFADFCDLVVAGDSGGSSCVALDVVDGFRVAYTPQQSPWALGHDASGSGLALFSADVGSGESSCMQLRFPEEHALTGLSLDYRVPSEDSGGMLTIELQRDEEENELILGLSSPEFEWIEFQHTVNLDRTRVSGLLACYRQGAMEGSALDRAGLDDLSFDYEYVYDRNEFCDAAVQGGSAGENCEWIRGVQSSAANILWRDTTSVPGRPRQLNPSSWGVYGLGREFPCLRLLMQPRLDSSLLAGLSFNFAHYGGSDRYEFRIQRVGQQNTVRLKSGGGTFSKFNLTDSYTYSDLGLTKGLISDFILCYGEGRPTRLGEIQFELNALRFRGETAVVSRLRSTLPPRRFHIARRPQSVDFAVQALSQVGTVIDSAVQAMLTARSAVTGMRLSLSVPDTGQSVSGEGEVSLPLSFSGEQNVVLGFNIPLSVADGTVLEVTVSSEEKSIAGESRELALFDFCGLAVQGGRDDEGGADLQRSCSDFAQAVSALRFDPPDKPWRLGEGQTEDSGQALFSAELDSGESSCMRLRLNEDRRLLAAKFGYTVDAGTSAGALTISLERDGEAGEEILRESGEVAWTSGTYTVGPSQSRVVGISICYEKGADGGDAGLDWAGVDNIRLELVDPVADFCNLVVAGGSGGSSCAALAEAAESSARVSYDPAESPWRVGDGPTADSGLALFSAGVESGESSCLRLQFRDGRRLVALNFAYTVRAGLSSNVLTIALHRAGEAAEEVLRQSGEQDWTEMLLPTAISGRRPAEGVSICYEKGSGGGDAGLDRAGVDNIRLEPVDPVTNFCDLVVAGGSGGSSCAALAEAAESTARVSYEPAGSRWRLGEGPTEDSGLALFSAAIEPAGSSCLRLQLLAGRQLVSLDFAYTVAGTSSGALTIVLHRDGEAGEEVLRRSGALGWTEMLLPTATPGRLPVEGVSICYEKGADGGDASQDRAGVDNIRLETANPLVDFCDLVMEDGSGGSSCAALAEAAESSARVSYVPAKSPWRLGEGPTADFGLALFSAAVGSGERSCLRLRLNEGRQLLAANFWYRVAAGTSTGALTISLERDEEAAAEEILRESVEAVWATLRHTVDLRRPPVVGISICYEKGSGTEAGLDRAGVDNIRLETASPLVDFCDLVMAGGSGGSSCAALAEAAESSARVSYVPAESPWRLGEGPTVASGLALFSGAVEPAKSSCLRLRLREGRQLLALDFASMVSAVTSTGVLTISLERDGEAAEEILRESGEVAWATESHTVAFNRSRVVGISICYERGSGGGDAGLDGAGVDNIQLETLDTRVEFCNLVVTGGSGGSNCALLSEGEDSDAKVSYEPAESLWHAGDGNSGLALFSADVGPGEDSCLQLRFLEEHALRELSLNYRALSEESGGILTIELRRDGEDDELILGIRSPESEWIEFRHAVDLDRARVSGLLVCYQQGAMEGLASVRAGLDDLSFVSEYVYDRNELCDLAVQGGRAGENCEWIRGVQSNPVDKLWEDGISMLERQLSPSWAVGNLRFRQGTCLRLLLQPRLDSSFLAGLSFNFGRQGGEDRYEFRIQRVGQQNPETLISNQTHITAVPSVAPYTYSDLDLAGGLISDFILCYDAGRSRRPSEVQFELHALQFRSQATTVSRLRSTLLPRLFHIARRPQSVDFAVQGLSQLGTVIDSAVQTTLTARSGVAGMRLSLTVPETGQSASGEGEVSLPLSFSGEQNVVLGFNIPLAMADVTTLAVTVSGNAAVAGESRELRLFDFCGLTVHGGRDDEGDEPIFGRVAAILRGRFPPCISTHRTSLGR